MVLDALANVFAPILNPILKPLLSMPALWAILIISFFLSLISLLLTKYLTNQKMMKAHREEMKSMQKEMRVHTKEGRQDKAMALQKTMMEKNMIIMKESFKPMFITIIPFLLIFGWLYANFSFLPLEPQVPFDVDVILSDPGIAVSLQSLPPLNISDPIVQDTVTTFSVSGPSGAYTLQYTANNITVEQDLIIGTKYAKPEQAYSTKPFKKSVIGNSQLYVSVFGLRMTWFWAYFIFSIVFSLALRKILKVA